MKLGIIITVREAELVWNALRLANLALAKGDKVKIFLLAQGVEWESISSDKFPVTEQIQKFAAGKGEILACGTCLKIRQNEGSALCPISTMEDLYSLIQESDKVLTF